MWGIFAVSQYPMDEPDLPHIHIRRALGGLLFSAVLALAAGGLMRVVLHETTRSLLRFAWWENLLVFTVQMFVPLGFNDGSTL